MRYIAINDGVDSTKGDNDFTPLRNLFNEWFLRNYSRKQCAAYQARGHAGKSSTNRAIYGYRKDPEDKHHWLIDEDAATGAGRRPTKRTGAKTR